MCGITYRKIQETNWYFQHSSSRGLDGSGGHITNGDSFKFYGASILWWSLEIHGRTRASTPVTSSTTKEQLYVNFLDMMRNNPDYAESRILLHHRKSSIGSTNEENVHPFPFYNGKYTLMQNGSAKELHGWGVMNFVDSDDTRSDTYYLARLMETRWADTFSKMLEVFNELIAKRVSLGVVVIYNTEDNTFFIVSDGARSLYIGLNVLDNNYIDYFSSISNTGSDEFSFRGFMVVDAPTGEILNKNIEYLNKYTKKSVAKQPVTYSRFNDEDDYEYCSPSHNSTSHSRWATGVTKGVTISEKVEEKETKKGNEKKVLQITEILSIGESIEDEFWTLYAENCTTSDNKIINRLSDLVTRYESLVNMSKRNWLSGFTSKESPSYTIHRDMIEKAINEKVQIMEDSVLGLCY